MNIKKHLNTGFNVLFALFIIYLIFQQYPNIKNNYSNQGKTLAEFEAFNIANKDKLHLFEPNEKYILFFWATWCAPCKIEMKRYADLVNSGHIPQDKFIAISSFEDAKTIQQFIKKHSFPFTFIEDGKVLVNHFQVKATPTVVHVSNQKAEYVSTGVTTYGMYKAKNYFDLNK